jgi:hypothetical protein
MLPRRRLRTAALIRRWRAELTRSKRPRLIALAARAKEPEALARPFQRGRSDPDRQARAERALARRTYDLGLFARLLGAGAAGGFRIRRERPVDFNSIAVPKYVIRPDHPAEDA